MATERKFKANGVGMVEIDGIRYREDDTAVIEAAKARAAAADKARRPAADKSAAK
jgi:hypothetical protein